MRQIKVLSATGPICPFNGDVFLEASGSYSLLPPNDPQDDGTVMRVVNFSDEAISVEGPVTSLAQYSNATSEAGYAYFEVLARSGVWMLLNQIGVTFT